MAIDICKLQNTGSLPLSDRYQGVSDTGTLNFGARTSHKCAYALRRPTFCHNWVFYIEQASPCKDKLSFYDTLFWQMD